MDPEHAEGVRPRGGALALAFLVGCAGEAGELEAPRYASEVVWFEPGPGAGFGASEMPGVVLGAPGPGAPSRGSTDVVSLGAGGSIALGFGGAVLVDGPGDELVVYENPFRYGPGGATVFAEAGEVAVSWDGESWASFPCDPETGEGCAGFSPLGGVGGGGDRFDLGAIGVERARYVRLTDRSRVDPVGPTAGFDLDAIEALSARPGE